MKSYDQRNNKFSNKIVPLWDSLTEEVVNSISANQFKARKHPNDKNYVLTERAVSIENSTRVKPLIKI